LDEQPLMSVDDEIPSLVVYSKETLDALSSFSRKVSLLSVLKHDCNRFEGELASLDLADLETKETSTIHDSNFQVK
jgi:hypothetical protein